MVYGDLYNSDTLDSKLKNWRSTIRDFLRGMRYGFYSYVTLDLYSQNPKSLSEAVGQSVGFVIPILTMIFKNPVAALLYTIAYSLVNIYKTRKTSDTKQQY